MEAFPGQVSQRRQLEFLAIMERRHYRDSIRTKGCVLTPNLGSISVKHSLSLQAGSLDKLKLAAGSKESRSRANSRSPEGRSFIYTHRRKKETQNGKLPLSNNVPSYC